jgi:hypothetical protein
MPAFAIRFVLEPTASGTNCPVLLALRLKVRNAGISIGETLDKIENIHDDFILSNYSAKIMNVNDICKSFHDFFFRHCSPAFLLRTLCGYS